MTRWDTRLVVVPITAGRSRFPALLRPQQDLAGVLRGNAMTGQRHSHLHSSWPLSPAPISLLSARTGMKFPCCCKDWVTCSATTLVRLTPAGTASLQNFFPHRCELHTGKQTLHLSCYFPPSPLKGKAWAAHPGVFSPGGMRNLQTHIWLCISSTFNKVLFQAPQQFLTQGDSGVI